MSLTIIIKDGKPQGITRTSLDEKFQAEWGGSSFASEEEKDQCAFAERQIKKQLNADNVHPRAAVFKHVGKRPRKP